LILGCQIGKHPGKKRECAKASHCKARTRERSFRVYGMRALALVGLLTTASCGLDTAGLGADPSDAQGTPDATEMRDVASPKQDGATGHDSSMPSPGDSGSSADAVAPVDGNSADIGAADSGDGGSGGDDADTGTALDASDADVVSPPSDGGADDALDGSADDGSADDGSAGEAGEGGPPCASAIPSGWSLAVYDLGVASCPANFTAHDVSGPPSVGGGACSCTCGVTQDGTCTVGTLMVSSSSGNGTLCNMTTFSGAVNGPGCTPLAVTFTITGPTRDQASVLPPQGGTCSDVSNADATQVSTPAARYCDVPADSADSVCNGAAPPGFAACIATGGVTTCPPASPFVNQYVVEDGVQLQCSACAACTVTTTCSGATLTGFRDTACTRLTGSVPVDGACNDVLLSGFVPAPVAAIEYAATATSTCVPGSSTPTTQLTNPRTICCR
jgi:hypothetical protein